MRGDINEVMPSRSLYESRGLGIHFNCFMACRDAVIYDGLICDYKTYIKDSHITFFFITFVYFRFVITLIH